MPRLYLYILLTLLACTGQTYADKAATTLEDAVVEQFAACEHAKPHCMEQYASAVRDVNIMDVNGNIEELAHTVYAGGWVLRLIGEWQGAETAFLRAKGIVQANTTIQPDTHDALLWLINVNLGQLYIDEKRYAAAYSLLNDTARHYARPSANEEGALLTWALVGDALMGLRRYPEAEQAYQHANSLIEHPDSDAPPRQREAFPGQFEQLAPSAVGLRFAKLYLRQRKYDQALALTEAIVKPSSAAGEHELMEALEVTAAIYLARKQDSKAEALLLRALSMREAEIARQCSISPLFAKKTVQVLTQLIILNRKHSTPVSAYTKRAARFNGLSDRHPFARKTETCY